MTAEEEKDLREMQAELSAAEQSPWQPAAVARTFRSGPATAPFVFRMQTWIDLSAVESPFLLGDLPVGDEGLLERFREAFVAFGWAETTPENCDAGELILLGKRLIAAVEDGFAMSVRLVPPDGGLLPPRDEGMGTWLGIIAFLVGQMGLRPVDALDLPVGQAFALIAAHRVNTGWTVAGETYVTREVRHG